MTKEELQAIRKDWPLTELSVNEDVLINKLCDEIERLRVVEAEFNKQIDALDDAEHEITRRDAEIQELWEQKRIMSEQWLDHESTIRRQSKEIERLRGALEFYANEENHWRSHHDDMCMSEVDNDGGYRARQALAGDSHDN